MDKKIAIGLLWMFSGPILLVVVMLLQVIVRFIFNPDGVIGLLLNIVSWTAGSAAVILFIAGPIIGIVIMSRSQKNSSK